MARIRAYEEFVSSRPIDCVPLARPSEPSVLDRRPREGGYSFLSFEERKAKREGLSSVAQHSSKGKTLSQFFGNKTVVLNLFWHADSRALSPIGGISAANRRLIAAP